MTVSCGVRIVRNLLRSSRTHDLSSVAGMLKNPACVSDATFPLSVMEVDRDAVLICRYFILVVIYDYERLPDYLYHIGGEPL